MKERKKESLALKEQEDLRSMGERLTGVKFCLPHHYCQTPGLDRSDYTQGLDLRKK